MKKTEKTAATAKEDSELTIEEMILEYAGLTSNKKRADELADRIKDYARENKAVLFAGGNTWDLGIDGLRVTKSVRSSLTIDQSKLMGKHITALKKSKSPECFTLKFDPKKIVYGDPVVDGVLKALDFEWVGTETFSIGRK